MIQVDDLREMIGHLQNRGVRVGTPSSPDGTEDFLTIWFTDPDGYRVELVQWPAGHPVGMTRADFADD